MHPAFTAIVDYAGLFPPASCTMDEAVSRYATYRTSADRWMLGRFVVGAGALADLAAAVRRQDVVPPSGAPWPLSVVIGADRAADLARIDASASGPLGDALRTEAIEVRVGTPAEVPVVARQFDRGWERFLEVPHLLDYAPILEAIGAAGAMAKLRTGGVTPDAFPTSLVVTRFLTEAVRLGVPFKATAGLHHPWRGRHPLTYLPGAASAPMYGFVAVLVATAALAAGAGPALAQAILEEEDPAAFRAAAGGITWRDLTCTAEDLAGARRLAFRGFGSCSFREPVDELAVEVRA